MTSEYGTMAYFLSPWVSCMPAREYQAHSQTIEITSNSQPSGKLGIQQQQEATILLMWDRFLLLTWSGSVPKTDSKWQGPLLRCTLRTVHKSCWCLRNLWWPHYIQKRVQCGWRNTGKVYEGNGQPIIFQIIGDIQQSRQIASWNQFIFKSHSHTRCATTHH